MRDDLVIFATQKHIGHLCKRKVLDIGNILLSRDYRPIWGLSREPGNDSTWYVKRIQRFVRSPNVRCGKMSSVKQCGHIAHTNGTDWIVRMSSKLRRNVRLRYDVRG